nr:MAG TPA: hypothetical protein [Caudoviricetes sp.]
MNKLGLSVNLFCNDYIDCPHEVEKNMLFLKRLIIIKF